MSIMSDGFNTTIVFPGAGVVFIEKTVTPPGLDGGGPIDITAMRNVKWRTMLPKYLITMTKMDAKVRWDALIYTTIVANLNVNRALIVNFPTLTNAPARILTFYGWLNKFAGGEQKEGEDPLADVEFFPSNVNAAGVEVAPTIT